jgi:hypothetical protein
VTAYNDDIDDDLQDCQVQTGPATSSDPVYAGRFGDGVTVSVGDDDTAGVTVDDSGLGPISEPDGSDTFSINLHSEPRATVSVDLTVIGGQCTVLPESVELDASNWYTGVVVTVTAVDDDIDDETEHCQVQTSRTSSTDPKYQRLSVDDVTVSVQDDDEAGIEVLPTGLVIGEPDGSDTFTLRLTSEPLAQVSIGLSTSDGECTVEPDSVGLDATNWAEGETATVTAVDDDLEDGLQTCLVQTGSATSTDPNYLGRPAADVNVTVEDDDIVNRLYMPLLVHKWPPTPDAPTLHVIDNEDGDGNYAVSWSSVAYAQDYVLEESTDGAFSSVKATYNPGTDYYEITEHVAGRFYYRVKARNAWGDSGWSAVEQVDVLWHQEANDQPGDNGPVASGLTYSGILPDASDQRDYFYFELAAQGPVRLDLTNIPAGQNYDLVLRNVNLETFPGWYSVRSGNRNESVQVAALPPGLYYIQVYRNPESSGGTSQAYDLSVEY